MAPSPTIRRLLKETAELSSPSSNPNPAFFAAPVSDADLHEWHFTLLGPPSPSPYAGGMYHGRITLPATYPLKPPNFRFLTPSGRFEVNREICLSISGFHEETWMPAWGVRTALTALRTFMAEKGSAGQVGGLEAPADVRKRLAKESRSWKCEACKKTNETIMREWWDVCREAGVNVSAEEDLGLESLPEGMSLEARDPSAQSQSNGVSSHTTGMKSRSEAAGAQEDPKVTTTVPQERRPQQQQPSTHPHPNANPSTPSTSVPVPPSQQPQPQPQPPLSSSSPPPSHTPRSNSSSLTQPTPQRCIPMVPTPSAEAAQASAEAVLTPGDFVQPPPNGSTAATTGTSTTARRPFFSGLHSAPLAAANAAIAQSGGPQPLTLQRDRDRGRETQQTITIDRAIAGVFLALCLMVLKKIFYPAGGAGARYSGMDEFYLQRE
ncbi:uncharacterized protein Z520_00947 [Fonsecaea multimorphosa CBS 102226]|uniref:UBC core domain-containing protein n=1 Tax=Fonsecaea multimorphosa CBS 102226 TaxID=1442371 RepID=A0A0D2KDR6_9EURO|nr:uncharacterized protein Z520_00947 [Fonsecaea multimorphosa CBS 102226]KIY04253.1 hypothetical protein Z520_00947 [Fonsecaea multimorphosa CBS 102226]OAL31658.1 hypothetical protein AYO22_00948 [Fonsecaea multimorphosa]